MAEGLSSDPMEWNGAQTSEAIARLVAQTESPSSASGEPALSTGEVASRLGIDMALIDGSVSPRDRMGNVNNQPSILSKIKAVGVLALEHFRR